MNDSLPGIKFPFVLVRSIDDVEKHAFSIWSLYPRKLYEHFLNYSISFCSFVCVRFKDTRQKVNKTKRISHLYPLECRIQIKLCEDFSRKVRIVVLKQNPADLKQEQILDCESDVLYEVKLRGLHLIQEVPNDYQYSQCCSYCQKEERNNSKRSS